jgi:hypothetical protein
MLATAQYPCQLASILPRRQRCSERGTRSSPPGRSNEEYVQDKRRSGCDKPSYVFVPFNHRGGLFMPYGDLRPRACHEMAKRCCLTHRCQDVNAIAARARRALGLGRHNPDTGIDTRPIVIGWPSWRVILRLSFAAYTGTSNPRG